MTTDTVATNKNILCRLHTKKIRMQANFPALSEIFAGLKLPSILGGNTAKKDADRFSYWGAQPKEVFEFRTGEKEPFEKFQRVLDKYKLEKNRSVDSLLREGSRRSDDLPDGIFCGGWMGYFSYELGRYIEKLPEKTVDDLGMSLIRLCFYDRLIAYDHLESQFWLIALELPDEAERPAQKIAGLEQLLSSLWFQ